MPEIILPIIHLNGTSAAELLDQRGETIEAIHAAGRALAAMGPNGRDYYPQPGLMDKAVAQHARRLKILKELADEIESEMMAIEDLRAERERGRR